MWPVHTPNHTITLTNRRACTTGRKGFLPYVWPQTCEWCEKHGVHGWNLDINLDEGSKHLPLTCCAFSFNIFLICVPKFFISETSRRDDGEVKSLRLSITPDIVRVSGSRPPWCTTHTSSNRSDVVFRSTQTITQMTTVLGQLVSCDLPNTARLCLIASLHFAASWNETVMCVTSGSTRWVVLETLSPWKRTYPPIYPTNNKQQEYLSDWMPFFRTPT